MRNGTAEERTLVTGAGGQHQRVALARSFVFNPKLLLFDEPLSNLDAKLRAQMRIELKQLTAKLGITSVYVTHDQEEALSLSDKVVVVDNGEILQQSDPYTVYYRPANTFVGDFMGASNILLRDFPYGNLPARWVWLETVRRVNAG